MAKNKRINTNVKIIEVTNQSGLTNTQRIAIDSSEHTIFQFPFMNIEMYQVLNLIKDRKISPKQIPEAYTATEKGILQSVYKRNKKSTFALGIEQTAYDLHKEVHLNPSLEDFKSANNNFYFESIEETIQSSKLAFEKFISHKQNLEIQIMQDIMDLTTKILGKKPSSICYVVQGETPTIPDLLNTLFSNFNNVKIFVQQPFTLDFRTQMYKKYATHSIKDENFELSDLEYLKLALYDILLDLSINEIDIPTQNFKLESSYLNRTRNFIINSFSTTDIMDLRSKMEEHWFGWDKSIEIVEEFKKRFPKGRDAGFVMAEKYLKTGFNLILPK